MRVLKYGLYDYALTGLGQIQTTGLAQGAEPPRPVIQRTPTPAAFAGLGAGRPGPINALTECDAYRFVGPSPVVLNTPTPTLLLHLPHPHSHPPDPPPHHTNNP